MTTKEQRERKAQDKRNERARIAAEGRKELRNVYVKHEHYKAAQELAKEAVRNLEGEPFRAKYMKEWIKRGQRGLEDETSNN